MSAKTKIIVIRKSQLAFTLVIFIIVLLLAGLIISAIVTQAHPKADSEPDTTATSGSSVTAAGSSTTESSAMTAGSSATESSATTADSSTTESSAPAGAESEAVSASAAVSSGSGSSIQYTPGVYTSTVILNDAAMEVQVIVDKDHINSISLINLDESIETAYPLVQPAIEELAGQITDSQSIDNVTYSKSNQYTSMILYNAICDALDKASADNT